MFNVTKSYIRKLWLKLGQTVTLQIIASSRCKKRLGQTVANCYIANYSIEKLQAIAKFSVKLSQYVHCKILAQTREQSYIVNYSIKCRKRLQYLRSNYCNPCIAHYFANYRKLLPNLRSNYSNPCIAHYFVNYRKLLQNLCQTIA